MKTRVYLEKAEIVLRENSPGLYFLYHIWSNFGDTVLHRRKRLEATITAGRAISVEIYLRANGNLRKRESKKEGKRSAALGWPKPMVEI